MEKPKAKVDGEKCLVCGGCISVCPQDAISMFGGRAFVLVDKCISCAICIQTCPVGAINGEVY
ncbi:4Fe-4S dicluster domain protein [Thermoplasmatales archaeon SCGC AB-539-C06]|nr:4Fe-4S dicluster domain protein [Thermoplasmatales archaeon SCGC AB-539-C06]